MGHIPFFWEGLQDWELNLLPASSNKLKKMGCVPIFRSSSPSNPALRRELVVGTGNPDKLREIRWLLKGLNIRVYSLSEVGKPPRVAENGRTFAANAAKKARAFSIFSGKLTLADDSGLCVRSLGGRPGVYSARFAGPGCSYGDNNRKLLRSLASRPHLKRDAFFICAAALYDRGKKVAMLKGVCEGRIADEARGARGFGYDPLFIPRGSKKTFAEMPPAEKNLVSHRGRALQAVRRFLKKYFSTASC